MYLAAEGPSGYYFTVNDCILNFVCLFAFQEEESFDKCVDETTFPRIIGSGDFWSLDPLCIAAEEEELVMLGAGSSMANALGLLLAVYYRCMYLTLPIQPRPVIFTFFVKR